LFREFAAEGRHLECLTREEQMAFDLLDDHVEVDVTSIRAFPAGVVVLVCGVASIACATPDQVLEETMRTERHVEQPMLMEAPMTPPLDPADGGPREVVGTLGDIRFAPGSTVLLPSSRARLDGFAAWLQREYPNGEYDLEIQGHTDAQGSDDSNVRLGAARADAVRRYLSARLEVPEERFSVVSAGSRSPAAEDRTAEGRSRNRRVVILALR
jgi:outer membrane protein OmpA-like peptidoglycan-associated protein